MLVNAIAVLPLTKKLKNKEKWKQSWYADDSACLAKFMDTPNTKPLQGQFRAWFT